MILLRRSDGRGGADLGWLDTRYTFSFAEYHDPEFKGFRVLRVINEDRIAGGAGFGVHPHRDMEILTWILSGSLRHEDSLGNGSVIRPGEAQRMTAGTGVLHSEQNPSDDEECHLLQIWILPDRGGHEPGYEQVAFPAAERRGRLRLIASPDGAEGSVSLHQDARVLATLLDEGASVEHALAPGRHGFVHVARGAIDVNGTALSAGDAVSASDEPSLTLRATKASEVLLFDLA